MNGWTIHQLLEATGGRLVRGQQAPAEINGISIDSRSLQPGNVFVAIRGPRFDGHHFLDDVAHKGASCLIVSYVPTAANGAASLPTILVDDTTEALGQIAQFHRRRMNRPVIAITGSCGKTTTKELIAHLLGDPERILKTTGTQNNHIGVPLTLLRLRDAHQMAVVELGSNHPGEIAYLAAITEPDVAVITNIGPVHLEFFGSVMGVLREKLSLLRSLTPGGSAVLPGDQLDVCLEAGNYLPPNTRVVTYGMTERCDLQVLDIQRAGQGMVFRLRDLTHQWAVPLVGYHNVENALAALACAWALGNPLSATRQRLERFEAVPLRSEVVQCGGVTILNDCYNANPLSFARALETLRDLEVARTVAIVGDMLELGDYAPSAHQAIGRKAAQLGIDRILAVGDYAEEVARGVHEERTDGVAIYRSVEELLRQLPSMLQAGDGLLVKGSRKLHLERVADLLMRGGHNGQHALIG